ncbi:hypothetical protein VNI00_000070 [Paramarasmius palmivorus]|uniref:Uncharacterized protein n=1 Tax=Paramarasmius palmivorus TaxID=297713 RepID=A0AAW0EGG6_9AGAR
MTITSFPDHTLSSAEILAGDALDDSAVASGAPSPVNLHSDPNPEASYSQSDDQEDPDPDVRQWNLMTLGSLSNQQMDAVVEVVRLIVNGIIYFSVGGLSALGPLAVLVEAFAMLAEEEEDSEDEFSHPIAVGTDISERRALLAEGHSWKCGVCKAVNSERIVCTCRVDDS